jgi:hypothetical protein
MSMDIARILEGWEYAIDELRVRLIAGDDGQEKIQLRVDMGVIQMEIAGRPDGRRPEGFESWLEYYQEQERRCATADESPFALSEDDCARLWREAVQYYQRYLSFWHLKRYDACVRDTERNLRLFAFAKQHASSDRAKWQFDQWRPYVLMMRARAMATPMVEQSQIVDAIRVVDAAIGAIRDFLDEYQQAENADPCLELANLEQWREEIVAMAETSQEADPAQRVLVLRRDLQAAVADERFEEAAKLRDEIRRLTEQQTNPGDA